MLNEAPLIHNPAKEIIKNGGPIFGFNVFESLRPSIIKIAAQTGYNMLLVENEHVVHNEETLTNFLVMARDNGLAPTVTALVPDRPFVSRMLDAGALGICLSHAEEPEQVAALARWMKYAPAGERGLAMGLISGSAGVGLACGPLIGGILVDMFDWRAIFWIRLPVGALAFLLALIILEWGKGVGVPKLDIAGAVTLFITLVGLLLAINQTGRMGINNPFVVIFGLIGIIGLISLIKVELQAARPVLDLRLFRLLPYSVGMLTLISLYMGDNTVKAIAPFILINGLQLSASKAGLFIGLYHGMRLPISPVIGILSDRLGTAILMISGLALLSLGLFIIGLTVTSHNEVALWIGFLLAGIGTATFDPANGSSIMGSVPKELLGNGSAAVATGRQIGLTIGGTLATAIFASTASDHAALSPITPLAALPNTAVLVGGSNAMMMSATIALFGTLIIFALFKKSLKHR